MEPVGLVSPGLLRSLVMILVLLAGEPVRGPVVAVDSGRSAEALASRELSELVELLLLGVGLLVLVRAWGEAWSGWF